MKYCISTTTQHNVYNSFPESRIPIQDMIRREGGNSKPFPSSEIIDLDNVAKVSSTKSKCDTTFSTMDIAMGVSDDNRNCHMIIADCKFRCKNPKNIKKRDVEKKVDYSKKTLKTTPPILDTYYFIFNNKCFREAISHFARLFNNSPSKQKMYVPITENEFKNTFF